MDKCYHKGIINFFDSARIKPTTIECLATSSKDKHRYWLQLFERTSVINLSKLR
ncbi:hypothetical protein Hanom_Chr11g01001291 [Helianthus anomalus]